MFAGLKTFMRRKQYSPLVFGYQDILNAQDAGLFDALRAGEIVLVRGVKPIIFGRNQLIELGLKACPSLTRKDFESFYSDPQCSPSVALLEGLSAAIKEFRTQRTWSKLLHPLFLSMKLPEPALYDGGIPRLVVPDEAVARARCSDRFEPADFRRLHAAGQTEIFMPRPANIHRDFNREHYLFQFNMWWPMHDADEKEVVRIFPQVYRDNVFDQECTPEALSRLGRAVQYNLQFGDAVLFHGEHLHTSPVGGSRRQSVDFRVAVACPDDNKHYREGFLDSRNFLLGDGDAPVDRIIAMEEAVRQPIGWMRETLAAFDAMPFSEDRYLLLFNYAVASDKELASKALRAVIERSPHYFWVLLAGQLAKNAAESALAEMAADRIELLASKSRSLASYMVVPYVTRSRQLDASSALDQASRLRTVA